MGRFRIERYIRAGGVLPDRARRLPGVAEYSNKEAGMTHEQARKHALASTGRTALRQPSESMQQRERAVGRGSVRSDGFKSKM